MSHHKLDRLFREKSETYQVTPGRQRWADIEARLPKEKSAFRMYWRAAAVVIVLISISLIIMDQMEPDLPDLAEITVDQPSPMDQIEIMIPGKTVPIKSTEPDATVTTRVFAEHTEPPDADKSINRTPKSMIATLEVAKKHPEMLTRAPNVQFMVQTVTIGSPRIKIEYYADATGQEEDASKGKIGKLLEKAMATSPADLLADIREAKDNFINSTLNLD